jgi:hypothetical protein
LRCWKRYDSAPVSGCDGNGVVGKDYCFDPTNDNFNYTHTIQEPLNLGDTDSYFIQEAVLPNQCEIFISDLTGDGPNGYGTVDVPFHGLSGKTLLDIHGICKSDD